MSFPPYPTTSAARFAAVDFAGALQTPPQSRAARAWSPPPPPHWPHVTTGEAPRAGAVLRGAVHQTSRHACSYITPCALTAASTALPGAGTSMFKKTSDPARLVVRAVTQPAPLMAWSLKKKKDFGLGSVRKKGGTAGMMGLPGINSRMAHDLKNLGGSSSDDASADTLGHLALKMPVTTDKPVSYLYTTDGSMPSYTVDSQQRGPTTSLYVWPPPPRAPACFCSVISTAATSCLPSLARRCPSTTRIAECHWCAC